MHDSKVEMMKRFQTVKAEAERKDEVVYKTPLVSRTAS